MSACEILNLDTDLTPFTKANSKWMGRKLKKQNKTLKFPEKYMGENLGDLEFDDEFLDTVLKHGS